jgi:1-aminocyclopropane-1-carboxylate deaminase
MFPLPPSPLTQIFDPIFEKFDIKFFVKRDDLLHPEISGNKWRKLKYNLIEARNQGFNHVLTFGGAFSNHIYATAAAGKVFDFQTVGVIRGDELNEDSSPTLSFAKKCGMKLIFVSRESYRDKEIVAKEYSKTHFVIPEGGTNSLAIRGVSEIYHEITEQLGHIPDMICTSVGTGGTMAGLCSNSKAKVVGFCALKNGNYLEKEIIALANNPKIEHEIFWDYHFGGYAKVKTELIDFINDFEKKHPSIQIEQVYTGKMFWGIYDLIQKGYFEKSSTIVALHTGGLQGRSL